MDETEEALPGVLAEIEQIAGRQAALSVALALGGQSIHVPRPQHLNAGHSLATTIGAGAAKICERFQGECLYIPKARRHLVRHLAARGIASQEIASRLGITVRGARQHLKRD